MPGHWIRRSLAAVLLCTVALSVGAQPQEPGFKNLKVLPKDVSHDELLATMRMFTRALGVRCAYCHVDTNGDVKPEDFQKDDKPTKRIAREMLRMVKDINENYIGYLETQDKTQPASVKCFTCHHGVAKPRTLQEVLTASYEQGGIDSTMARYQALRNRYYGRAAYDFGEVPLTDVSGQLAQQGHPDDAMRLLEYNVEMNPNSMFAKHRLASATIVKGFMTSPEAGTAAYQDMKTKYGADMVNEGTVDDVAHQLMGSSNAPAAIAALKLNVAENPKSTDALESLGEAYVANGDWKPATETYKKVLTLDPANENAKKALDDIKVKSKQKPAKKKG